MTTLDDLYKFAGIVAYEMADPSDRQDASQEGCIAAWRAWGANPEQPYPYYRTVVKNAIRSFLGRGTATGRQGRRGWQEAEMQFTSPEGLLLASPSHRDDYPSDYSHVREAVDALPEPDREIVVRHFWGDEDFSSMAAGFGKSRDWANATFQRRTAPALRQLLAAA